MDKVNKLISIKPLKSRYVGEIGDVVVARITEVQQKRWKVNTNSRLDSILFLAAVNLPGGMYFASNKTNFAIWLFDLTHTFYCGRWIASSIGWRWTNDAKLLARRWSHLGRSTKCICRRQLIAAYAQFEIRQIVTRNFGKSVSVADKASQNTFSQFNVRCVGDSWK